MDIGPERDNDGVALARLWLLRHGETEWSLTRRHTGRTDKPLTAHGEEQARALKVRLAEQPFTRVVTSPLLRARDTCTIAGFPEAETEDDLMEWDYGAYEGRTTAEIREDDPDFSIWTAPLVGETVDTVGARADRILARVGDLEGEVALFAHAHTLRILAARWLGLDAVYGRRFMLATASLSILGHEHGYRTIARWNDTSHFSPSDTTF